MQDQQDWSPGEVAEYIEVACVEMSRAANCCRLPLLAYLLDLARQEASTRASSGQLLADGCDEVFEPADESRVIAGRCKELAPIAEERGHVFLAFLLLEAEREALASSVAATPAAPFC